MNFTIASWNELAILIGIISVISGILGGLIRYRLDKGKADVAASDRLIVLIEKEADKKVSIVRTEFQLKLADLELKHRDEIAQMRNDFEAQIKKLRSEETRHRCELAPICSWRNAKLPPPAPAP
jgi:hypothetical protein